MANKRHGRTVRIVATAIQNGSLGGRLLYSDSELGGRTARRMDPQIPGSRSHTIPDVVFFPNLDPNRLNTTALAPLTQHERKVVIFEFGHTSDKLMVGAMEEKCRQHAAWAEHLRGQADTWEVVVYPVVVSHSGLLPQTLADGLVACGLTARAAKRAVNRVVAATVACTERLWKTRRKLLHELDRPDPG